MLSPGSILSRRQKSFSLISPLISALSSISEIFALRSAVLLKRLLKTRADNAEMLKSAYGEQLEIYAAACEKIFKKKVKQRIIYSFALSREISV